MMEQMAERETVGVLNTSILTAPGTYKLKIITLEQAREIAKDCELDSAVGHAATAQVLSLLLQVNVPFKRQQFNQKVGQRCIVFKLRERIPEGVILTEKEIHEIGYDLMLLTRAE